MERAGTTGDLRLAKEGDDRFLGTTWRDETACTGALASRDSTPHNQSG